MKIILRFKLLITDEQLLVACLGLALSGMKVCVIIALGAEAFTMRLGSQKQRSTAVLGLMTLANGKECVWDVYAVVYTAARHTVFN
jgi:hypothetical protein